VNYSASHARKLNPSQPFLPVQHDALQAALQPAAMNCVSRASLAETSFSYYTRLQGALMVLQVLV
jgi:hypothetical protein